MEFLYEKEARRYVLFLTVFWGLLVGAALFAAKWQAEGTKRVLLEREQEIASALLLSDIAPGVIAGAYRNREITAEGITFMEKTGWSAQSEPWLLPVVGENAAFFRHLVAGLAAVMGGLLLGGSILFLQKREKMYREVEKEIAAFADGDFSARLDRGEEGTFHRMLRRIDELSLALQTKGEAARSARQALQDAVSDISHQLKTPMAALTMYAEILLEEADRPCAVQMFAQKSLQSLERMESLLLTLLKVMRLDAGGIVFVKERCKVSDLIGRAISQLQERAREEGKRILQEGRAEDVLCCDLLWTAEAVSNLVKNALDHTQEGGTIRIGWQGFPHMLRLWVEDDGCGIAEEDIPYIFKRFYRSRNASDRQGVGLGLALAKSILEGQGGILSVESVPGEGALFTVMFPLTEL